MNKFKRGRYYTHERFMDVFVRCMDVKVVGLKYHVTFQYWNRGQDGLPYLIRNRNFGPIEIKYVLDYSQLNGWSEYAVSN
jgi:hypothetical protein